MRPPDLDGKVNFVLDMWNNPCDAPWYVYIETAWPAALQMVATIVCFDFDDIVRWIFRPAGLSAMSKAGRKGGRRGRRRLRGLSARVRSKVPALKAVRGRKVTNGVKYLWRVDTFGQKLMWWWLVFDAGTTFIYNWTSALYKTEECQLAHASGAGAAEGTGSSYGGPFPPLTISTPDIQYNRGTVHVGSQGVHVDAGVHRVIGSVSGTAYTFGGSEAQLYVNVMGGPSPWNAQIDAAVMTDGQGCSLLGSVMVQGPCQVRILCGTAGGWLMFCETMLVAAGGAAMAPPDTYACWMQKYL